MKQYKSLRRSELQKLLTFECCMEYIVSKWDNDVKHTYRSIDDIKTVNKTMCILDAMKFYRNSLRNNSPWTGDLFTAKCSNCTIYIDGWQNDEDGKYFIGAYLMLPKASNGDSFEFIIHYMGDVECLEDSDEFSTLENLHYIEEGKVLRLDENFQIKK